MGIFDETTAVFPNNVVELIYARLIKLYKPEGVNVVKRPLNETDNSMTIGVYPDQWIPDIASMEFTTKEPTVQIYTVQIQGLVSDMDEALGIARHSVMSKVIRAFLYNDATLQIGLNSLYVEMFGSREVIQKRGVNRQKYLNNEIDGVFIYLSTLEYYFETETKTI